MTSFIFSTKTGLFCAMLVGHLMAAWLGRALPKASLVLAAPTLSAVLACWTLMAFGNPDGPGGGLGMLMVGVSSLVLLCTGAGLIAGSLKSIGVSGGLVMGLALGTALLLLFPHHLHPAAVAALLLASPVVGHQIGIASTRRGARCGRDAA